MNARPLILATLAFAALCSPMGEVSAAQDRLGLGSAKDGEATTGSPLWTCIVGNTSQAVTMIKLSSVISVSKHTYLVDNSLQMREVTIDTEGNNTIRFYCVSSARANSMADRVSNARDLLDKHTEGGTRYPGKKYPEGTHSHNIEYQVGSTADLDTIYESITHAWVKNKGCTLKLK